MRCDGNSGWVTTIVFTPAATAASTTVKISSRDRWPVASTRSWRATTASTSSSSGSGAPSSSSTGTGRGRTPAARRSSSKRTHTGTLPSGSACSTSANSFAALTVGSHTIRAPWRAATSTAVALSPPTAWLSVIVPSARDAGDGGGDDRRALRGRGVVRLQAEPGQPELEAALGELEVGDPPRREVRRDVHVRVERAAHELARALRGDRMVSHDAAER